MYSARTAIKSVLKKAPQNDLKYMHPSFYLMISYHLNYQVTYYYFSQKVTRALLRYTKGYCVVIQILIHSQANALDPSTIYYK